MGRWWPSGYRSVVLGWFVSFLCRCLSIVATMGGFANMGRFWLWVGGF